MATIITEECSNYGVCEPDLEEFEIPIPCRVCGGQYAIAFRFLSPGTVLRCPHCGAAMSPTRHLYLAVADLLDRYAEQCDAEGQRHRRAIDQERVGYENRLHKLRGAITSKVETLVHEHTEPSKKSLFG